jgi:hypothetical protein
MAWQTVTPTALLARLSDPERRALEQVAAAPDQANALAEIAALVVADWRGGLRRVTRLHADRARLPEEIMLHVLADFRYRAFTRLPNMRSLLDELRVREWERAMRVRDNLADISVEEPDDPEGALTGRPLPSVSVPPSVLD